MEIDLSNNIDPSLLYIIYLAGYFLRRHLVYDKLDIWKLC